jgi:hypothetical protein
MNQHVRDAITPGDKCGGSEELTKTASEKQNKTGFLHYFIISESNSLRKAWGVVFLLACFTSPYFYAWEALFGIEKGDNAPLMVSIVFESIFATNILINCLTDYLPDGEIVPERDLAKICSRYFTTEFAADFIPTFPFTFFFDTSPE